MSNQQSDLDLLVDKIHHLQDDQKTLAKYIVELKGRLDTLTEQFNNRPEIR
jgi:peptidoglycan hydrolase CwlO-like protein